MTTLLFIHSILRWLVILSILLSIFIGWRGVRKKWKFNKQFDSLRHWTATLAHVQLIVGFLLASKSPYFTYFWKHMDDAWVNADAVFFGLIHPVLMFLSIVILTIGSAKAKRKVEDRSKFTTMLIWYSIAAILIVVAIPWPFSPFSSRPFIPTY